MIGLRKEVASFAIALCVSVWLTASGQAAAQNNPACSLDASANRPPDKLPVDLCNPFSNDEKAFDALAWQTFKFLVWPAQMSSTERGAPDTQRKITDIGGPRTFETFKADWETFQPHAVRPDRWGSYPDVATPCTNHPKINKGALVLASFSEFGNLKQQVDLTGVSNVLVAQNRTYVRYLAAYNEQVFDTIRSGRLYDANTLQQVNSPQRDAAVPAGTIEPEGALTVKSAWVELPEADDPPHRRIDSSRFYVRKDAWLQDPVSHYCRQATVALVGLHFVHKTSSRPQWIWTTFEQVDNAPENGDHPGKAYTFNNGDPRMRMKDVPDANYRIPLPAGTSGPGFPPKPYQVERLQRVQPVAEDTNRAWQTDLHKLGSVWQYYKLVVTQWPETPFSPKEDATETGARPHPSCGGRGSYATVNTTMETFLQTQRHCDPAITCMGCHNRARPADFVWSVLMNAYSSSKVLRTPLQRVKSLRTLQGIVQGAEAE
jgi:hypothetical protein